MIKIQKHDDYIISPGFVRSPLSPQLNVKASTSTLHTGGRGETFTELLTSKTPIRDTLDRGVAAAVAGSEALTEGLMTPDRQHAPSVDEHSDYLLAVELQKSLDRRTSERTRKTTTSTASPSTRRSKTARDLFSSPSGKGLD